jgi:RhoGEF domain
VQSYHVRKISSHNVPSPILQSPEALAKEVKRLRTRYKIISEMISTENTFLQDMRVMEEGYDSCCHECPVITAQQKQAMFGRTKNVVIFSTGFFEDLTASAKTYLNRSESEITEAPFELLDRWDSETSIGEAFWSSVRSKYRSTHDLDGED